MKPDPHEDTIAAISTPPGEGAVGIVRLSGDHAIDIVSVVFASSRNCDIRTSRQRVFYGHIRDRDDTLDEVLVHVMRSPHTYTREDVVEINCHGGAAPLQAVLELVLRCGARLAEPGEFTKRAFLNGRIDLVQAEAVIDRIRAQSRAGLRAADAAANGVLSKALREIRDALVYALARIEAAVDFPDDDLPELVDEALISRLRNTHANMARLLATANSGRLYREGATVAIAGRPNVGKSSLFNTLVRDARAIVTAQPGTTRDVLHETITVEGIPIRLVDTAGLREAQDEVEQIGVERARSAIQTADVVLIVMDATNSDDKEECEFIAKLSADETPVIVAINKIDLEPVFETPEIGASIYPVSAKTGQGIAELERGLARLLLRGDLVSPDQGMITRVHQKDSLRRAIDALDRMLGNLQASPEFLSIDLREAINAVGQITGETTPDDVLAQIFSQFCIGK